MKNKSKKILAGIGIGVMGALALTGCSMSDEQQAALDKVVGKVDKVIELVENQNRELSHAEAIRLYEFAKTRLLVNKDNVWDNMKMTISQDSNEEDHYGKVRGEQHFYTFANGKRVCYGKTSVDSGTDYIGGWFSEVIPEEPEDENQGVVGTITSSVTYSCYVSRYATSIIEEIDITEDDIVDCKILDNGNYHITASLVDYDNNGTPENTSDDLKHYVLIEIEVTADGYLVSHTSNVLISHPTASFDKYVLTTAVKYEYGTLNDTIVQSNIDAYIAQEAASN